MGKIVFTTYAYTFVPREYCLFYFEILRVIELSLPFVLILNWISFRINKKAQLQLMGCLSAREMEPDGSP